MKIPIPATSRRGITEFSPLSQVLPHAWNLRSKLRGILLRRINGMKNAHQREEDEMQRYEHLTIRAAFRAGGTSKVNFINDEAVGGKQIAFYPYLNKLGDEGWEIVAFDNDIFVLKRLKE